MDRTKLLLAALAIAVPSLALAQGNGVTGDTTIVAGGAAQTLFNGKVPALGYAVSNPSLAGDCWVSDSATAAPNAAGSHRVAANGGEYRSPAGYKPQGPVTAYCPTTGAPISAEAW